MAQKIRFAVGSKNAPKGDVVLYTEISDYKSKGSFCKPAYLVATGKISFLESTLKSDKTDENSILGNTVIQLYKIPDRDRLKKEIANINTSGNLDVVYIGKSEDAEQAVDLLMKSFKDYTKMAYEPKRIEGRMESVLEDSENEKKIYKSMTDSEKLKLLREYATDFLNMRSDEKAYALKMHIDKIASCIDSKKYPQIENLMVLLKDNKVTESKIKKYRWYMNEMAAIAEERFEEAAELSKKIKKYEKEEKAGRIRTRRHF